jgi:membrane protease subunit HflK
VVLYLAGIDLFELMSSGLAEAARDLRNRIQDHADRLKLGVNIVLVGLQDLHPPVKVAPKFEEVVGALQENQAHLREAEGYAGRTVTLAKGEAQRRINESHSYSNRTVMAAVAQASQFTNQMAAYQASPQVYMERSYLQALERGITNSRKYVLATTNTEDLLQFNLEDKIRGDLINDLTIPSSKK